MKTTEKKPIKQALAFGGIIFEARKKAKMDRAKFSKTIGLTVHTLMNYETGATTPSFGKAFTILEKLKVDPSKLNDENFATAMSRFAKRRSDLRNEAKALQSKLSEVRNQLRSL